MHLKDSSFLWHSEIWNMKQNLNKILKESVNQTFKTCYLRVCSQVPYLFLIISTESRMKYQTNII